MPEMSGIFVILKKILFWASPAIFIFGIVLILYSNYKRLEEFFGKELFGIKKKFFPMLETNINVFQEWLLEKRTILGVIFIILAILFFFEFKK